jgi:hypothetical protein
MKPGLRFKKTQIAEIATRYDYSIGEDDLIECQPKVKKKGFLTKEALHKVAYWKSPRSSGHVTRNSDDYVQEITGFALRAKNERSRIEVLTLLTGVSMPTASVILHFFHPDPYPIIDYRALWSLRIESNPPYNFDVWWDYIVLCREIATANDVDMRTLDRALWQYSKENQ